MFILKTLNEIIVLIGSWRKVSIKFHNFKNFDIVDRLPKKLSQKSFTGPKKDGLILLECLRSVNPPRS